jgi:thiosulfate dehydrogenase [quinone] large subunit
MTTRELIKAHTAHTRTAHARSTADRPTVLTPTARKALAFLRVATGFIFLWAFLDKTFGLHYATASGKSWIDGGSPTKGFLGSVEVGPFQSLFHSMAGTWYADWLFMLGMLGLGVALIAGVAVRAAAVAGVIILAMMWFAEFPLAQHTSAGAPAGSSNPLVDYHFLYAVVLIVLATTYAGSTWGLGRVWARLPFVRDHAWAL